MTPEIDRNYRKETSSKAVQSLLTKTLKVLLVLLIGLAALEIGLLIWVAGQCSAIFGLSVEGRIFEAYSFTCPNPEVQPLYRGRPGS